MGAGCSASALEKVAVAAALCGVQLEEGAVGAAPFEPEDACVVQVEGTLVCKNCRVLRSRFCCCQN